ncbi:MAG: VanZ family protein [Flavobacteriaceae bacterium]|nr:VanZ family protein [Flavobacteriaceae bacterium]
MHKYILLIVSIFLTVAIVIGSLVPPQQIPIPASVSISDKLMHGSAYALLVFSWLCTKSVFLYNRENRFVLLELFLLGIVIEILQGTLTENRHSEWLDVVANSIGIIVGYLVFRLFFEKKIHKMKK